MYTPTCYNACYSLHLNTQYFSKFLTASSTNTIQHYYFINNNSLQAAEVIQKWKLWLIELRNCLAAIKYLPIFSILHTRIMYVVF